jgi:DNA-binding MarR family transcriptional regulator
LVVGLNKIGLAAKSRAWAGAEGLGLTPTQGQILTYLRSRPGGARLAAIAAALAVSAPTASEAGRTLVAKGLLEKRPAPDDRRAVSISLTPAGRRTADAVAGWSDLMLAAVASLSPAEQAVFLRALVKMIRTLQERGQLAVSRMCVTCRFFRPRVHGDPARPHHCAFVDAPFGDAHLRLDCPDHVVAPPDEAQRSWEVFASAAD